MDIPTIQQRMKSFTDDQVNLTPRQADWFGQVTNQYSVRVKWRPWFTWLLRISLAILLAGIILFFIDHAQEPIQAGKIIRDFLLVAPSLVAFIYADRKRRTLRDLRELVQNGLNSLTNKEITDAIMARLEHGDPALPPAKQNPGANPPLAIES